MKYLEYKERVEHGTFGFPIGYYYVDSHHPRYEMQFHWHPEYELIHVREGVLHLALDGERIDVAAGETVFVMDGVCHSGLPEDCLYECVVFDLGRFVTQNNIVSRELENILDHKRFVQRKLPSDTEGLRETVDQLFFSMRYQQRGYELFVRACLYQLLGIVVRDHLYDNAGAMARRSLNQQASLKNAVQYIREHYMQHVTLEELSRAAGMNRKYFCSFFRSITMKTPFEYLNSYRIEVAGEQLLRSDSTVAQIAVNCGFNDVSYFSKIFRRYMGDTPLNYRKKYKTVE